MSKKFSKDDGVVDRWGPYESNQNFNKSITYGKELNIDYRRVPGDAKKFDSMKLNAFTNEKAATFSEVKSYKGTARTTN